MLSSPANGLEPSLPSCGLIFFAILYSGWGDVLAETITSVSRLALVFAALADDATDDGGLVGSTIYS